MTHSPASWLLVVKDPGHHGHHVVLIHVVQEQEQDHSREPAETVMDLSMMIKLRIVTKIVPVSTLNGLTGVNVKERITVQTQENTTRQEKHHKDTTVLALKSLTRLTHVAYYLMIGLSGLPVLQRVERKAASHEQDGIVSLMKIVQEAENALANVFPWVK